MKLALVRKSVNTFYSINMGKLEISVHLRLVILLQGKQNGFPLSVFDRCPHLSQVYLVAYIFSLQGNLDSPHTTGVRMDRFDCILAKHQKHVKTPHPEVYNVYAVTIHFNLFRELLLRICCILKDVVSFNT